MWYLETILIKGLKGNVSALPNLISTEKEFDKKIRLKQPNTVLFKNKVICPFCFRKEYLTMQTCKMTKSETHETYYVRHHKLRAKSGKKLHLSCEACNTQLFVKPSRAIPALIFLEKILLIKHLDLNIARSVIRYTKTEELQTFLEKEDKGVTL